MLNVIRQPAVLNQPVVDPAAWTADDLASDQSWIHPLTESEIADLDAAVARVEERGLDILDITRDDFVLSTLGDRLDEIAADVVDGRGLALLRGVPVDRYSRVQSAIAFWGIGLFLGEPVSQNSKGHLLGHVADLGGTLKNPKHRGYQTHDMLPFHCDACDLVVLMCLHPAKSGGSSRFTSTLNVYNEMLSAAPSWWRSWPPPSTVTGATRSPRARTPGGSSRSSTSTKTI